MVITHRPAAPQSEADQSAGGRAPRLPAPCPVGPAHSPAPAGRAARYPRPHCSDGGRLPEARPPALFAEPPRLSERLPPTPP